jgi:hypothetical protein
LGAATRPFCLAKGACGSETAVVAVVTVVWVPPPALAVWRQPRHLLQLHHPPSRYPAHDHRPDQWRAPRSGVGTTSCGHYQPSYPGAPGRRNPLQRLRKGEWDRDPPECRHLAYRVGWRGAATGPELRQSRKCRSTVKVKRVTRNGSRQTRQTIDNDPALSHFSRGRYDLLLAPLGVR